MFSLLLPQLPAYFMISFSTLLSFVYLKQVRSLFFEATAIRNKMIASFMQACVVAVGLTILVADYYSLHSALTFVQQFDRAGSGDRRALQDL